MKKHQLLNKILEDKIVGIVRSDSSERVIRTVDACIEGGIKIIEVPFTSPKTHRTLEKLSEKYGGTDVVLGAGSVLDAETARVAILNGAEFIVTPAYNPETIRLCNRYNKLCTPGAMTIKEIVESMELGVELIKVFPASVLGQKFIKAVKGPLPQAMMMPTGGVTLDNAHEWLDAGASALAIGGSLTSGSKNGDYKRVTETAREFRRIIDEYKKKV